MNRYLEALKESYNGIGMAAIAAVSAATLSPWPLLVGVVIEAAYLMFIPDTNWYRNRLLQRVAVNDELARKKMREQILPTLRPDIQARFLHLEEMRSQIGSQDDKEWYGEVVQKLDYLLEKFLLFGTKEAQFQSYLTRLRAELRSDDWDLNTRQSQSQTQSRGGPRRPGRHDEDNSRRPPRLPGSDPVYRPTGQQDDQWVENTVEQIQAHYTEECDRISNQLEKEKDEANRAVLTKRIDVLQRRSEFAGKIGKILGNINHQLQLVDDTFGLINDEIRARSPEQILADIDEVVVATNSMTSALEELAPYEQMVARVG